MKIGMNFENFKNFHIKMSKKEIKRILDHLEEWQQTKVYYFFPPNFSYNPKFFFTHGGPKSLGQRVCAFTLEQPFDVRVLT